MDATPHSSGHPSTHANPRHHRSWGPPPSSVAFLTALIIAFVICLAAPLTLPASAAAPSAFPPKLTPPPDATATTKPAETNAHDAVIILDIFDDYNLPQPRIGFIAAPGIIITNRHCIEGATRARIRLSNQTTIPIRGLIAESQTDDLAILVLDASPEDIAALPMLRLSGQPAQVGDPVHILQRDHHLYEPMRNSGHVLKIEDSIWHGPDIITSARGDFGASGSPLVNDEGLVVGIIRAGGDDRREGEGEPVERAGPHSRVSSAAPSTSAQQLTRHEPIPLDQWWAKYDRPGWRAGRRELQWAYWHASRGDTTRARTHAEAALKHDPEQARAWGILARFHMHAGEFAEALECLNKWNEFEPDHPGVWGLLGSAHYRLGQFQESLEAYQRSMELAPSFHAAYAIAHTYGALGQYDEAIDALQTAMKIDPEKTDLWYFLAVALHRLDRLEEALDAYAEAIRHNPADPRPFFWTAQIHHKQDDLQQAEHYFKKAIEVDPKAHASYCGLATMFLKSDRFEEAETYYSKAVLYKSDCAQAIAGLVRCARARGDDAAATEWRNRHAALQHNANPTDRDGCYP